MDHFIELARASESYSDDELAGYETELKSEEALATCQKTVTRKQYDCALAAADLDALDACQEQGSAGDGDADDPGASGASGEAVSD